MYRASTEFNTYRIYAKMPLINVHTDVSNVNADVSSQAKGLKFSRRLHHHPYFVYLAAKALASLRICADFPTPSLLAGAIRTENGNRVTCLICMLNVTPF